MKKILLALSFLVAGVSFAYTPSPDLANAFNKLQGVPAASKYQLGTELREMHNTAVCVYDFATQGGAISTITLLSSDLKTSCSLPGKAVVRNGLIDVTTSPTSGGSATIAVGTGNATNDLLGATAISSLTSGRYLTTPVFATIGSYIKLPTANSIVNGLNVNKYNPSMTIATAALTAGHFRVFIDYVVGE